MNFIKFFKVLLSAIVMVSFQSETILAQNFFNDPSLGIWDLYWHKISDNVNTPKDKPTASSKQEETSATNLNQEQIQNIASKITVLVTAPSPTQPDTIVVFKGSGTIVARSGYIYYVLTNAHVINYESSGYKIRIFDELSKEKKRYPVEIVKTWSDVDLALLKFDSKGKNYYVPLIGDSTNLRNSKVYVGGWENRGTKAYSQFTKGLVQNRSENTLGYDNKTLGGMSGGAVLDERGRLVGIHQQKGGGIPIEILKKKASFLFSSPIKKPVESTNCDNRFLFSCSP